MSPSAHIVRRSGKRGPRWLVRFRWRSSDSRARHFASFTREKDAKIAQGWVMGEIAHGRYPDPDRYFAEPAVPQTLLQVHDEWVLAREHEVGAAAVKQARLARAKYGRLGGMDPGSITVSDVRRWVGELAAAELAPATIGAYRSVLRAALDAADLDRPNPARDARVKLPRRQDEIEDPPSYAHYLVMLANTADRHRPLLRFLEGTGVRIDEALRITWGDIDWRDDLLRVKSGKTRAARRWVPLLPVVRDLLDSAPADERTGPLFPGLTANSMRSAMRLACEKAGVPTYTPHDLRHRYTSLLVMAGVPAPLVGRIVGHRRVSVTLDTYSHVLLDEPPERLAELRRAAYRVPGARDVSIEAAAAEEVPDA